MDANDVLREQVRKAEATIRETLRQVTDEKLATTWLLTGALPMSEELAITRGWLIDELEARMDSHVFNEWLYADEDSVDPLPFLKGERQG